MEDLKIKQIFCGGDFSMILFEDGSLFSFGDNEFGQLGIGNNEDQKKTNFSNERSNN